MTERLVHVFAHPHDELPFEYRSCQFEMSVVQPTEFRIRQHPYHPIVVITVHFHIFHERDVVEFRTVRRFPRGDTSVVEETRGEFHRMTQYRERPSRST